MKKGDKRGKIGLEDIIFIILNLVFFAILLFFIYESGNLTYIYEMVSAKQIALIIDEAKPNTEIMIDMENAIKIAGKNGINEKDIVKIENNKVIIKLGQQKAYSYTFFSDTNVKTEIIGPNLLIKVSKKNGK